MGDCTHNFVYKGTVNTNDSLLNDNLVVRFDNLGDIIFNIQYRQLADTSLIDNNGNYKVTGSFFTACSSDRNIFNEKDSLSFELMHKGAVIQRGKLCIKNLDRKYNDSDYFTIISIPVIKTE
jgi:hypothetical protein